MKRVLLGVLCLALCASVFAQNVTGKRFEQPTLIDLRLNPTQLFRQATAPRAMVSTENPDSAFIFAVAGSTAAAGGTYFRSEVTLVNNDTVFSQNVGILYFRAGAGCNGALTATMNLKANTFYVWNDFVNSVFNTTGLGSVVVLGIDGAGNFDSTANIDGFSRIWTPVPGFRGTASQSFPGVALSGYPGTQWVYGVRNDADFRTNLFIFNYLPTGSTAPRHFNVNVDGLNTTGSFGMDVTPCSLGVSSLGGTNYGALIMSVAPPDSAGGWFAFGSTVDNNSGDNWSVAARPDRKP